MPIEWSAPRDGIVLERNAVQGMRAQPGDVLFRVADTSVVWALIDVAERDLGLLAVGQPVTVRARSFPARDFSGKIASIIHRSTARRGQRAFGSNSSNPDLALLPDMYVDADIETGGSEPVLVGSRKLGARYGQLARSSWSTRARAGSNLATSRSATGEAG